MICHQINDLFGFRCDDIGEGVAAVSSPFTFFDGDGMEVFVRKAGQQQLHLLDGGATLAWLHSVGVQLNDDRRRWLPIRNALKPYGLNLADDGVVEVFVAVDAAPAGIARMLSGLLAVDSWARDHAGIPADSAWLIEEAAMYLRAWKPGATWAFAPAPLVGISGQQHRFDLEFGGELVDAISSHTSATSHELRKVLDVKHHASNEQRSVMVIIDDRRDPEGAKAEAAILGTYCKAWPMTKLIAASGLPAGTQ